ncbi:hypothetical protein GCM10010833_24070 [Blastomonas aquatica]|uniref:Secreted protein n=1 Tax=Blastomonas aquatica TaxID=1510276 RepID=A0ABQ1JJQ2_9SPHN|nr:hypothetical protein GCM10010833_24070 [Blastomonas aquatica]
MPEWCRTVGQNFPVPVLVLLSVHLVRVRLALAQSVLLQVAGRAAAVSGQYRSVQPTQVLAILQRATDPQTVAARPWRSG